MVPKLFSFCKCVCLWVIRCWGRASESAAADDVDGQAGADGAGGTHPLPGAGEQGLAAAVRAVPPGELPHQLLHHAQRRPQHRQPHTSSWRLSTLQVNLTDITGKVS